MPTRRLPVRPDLTQLKHQAKDLLRDLHSGDAAAIAELGHATFPPPSLSTISATQLPSSLPQDGRFTVLAWDVDSLHAGV